MTLGSLVLQFFVNWLFLFIALYIVAEYGQYYLYEGSLPYNALRALGGSLLLAALLTWTRTSFDTMLTSGLGLTVIQGIAWFLVFTFVLQFHPLHGAVLGVATMLLIPGLATMAVDSLRRPVGVDRPTFDRPSKPLRTAVGPGLGGIPPAAKAAGAGAEAAAPKAAPPTAPAPKAAATGAAPQ
jgi:hypothetical protein